MAGDDAAAGRARVAIVALLLLVPPFAAALPRVATLAWAIPAYIAHPLDHGVPETAVVLGGQRLMGDASWDYPDPYVFPFHSFTYMPLTYMVPAASAAVVGGPNAVRAWGRVWSWASLAGVCAILAVVAASAARASVMGRWRSAATVFAALAVPTIVVDTIVRLSWRNFLASRGDLPLVLFSLVAALATMEAVRVRATSLRHATRWTLLAFTGGYLATGYHQLGVTALIASLAALAAAGTRREAALLGALTVVGAVVGFAGGFLLFGERFGVHALTLMGVNPWSFESWWLHIRRMPHVSALVVVVLAALATRWREPRWRAAFVWLATITALRILALMKAGASYNYAGIVAIAAWTFALLLWRDELLSAPAPARPRSSLFRRVRTLFPVAFILAATWIPFIDRGRLAEGPFPSRLDLALDVAEMERLIDKFAAPGAPHGIVTDDAALSRLLGDEPYYLDSQLMGILFRRGDIPLDAHPFLAMTDRSHIVSLHMGPPGGAGLSYGGVPFLDERVRQRVIASCFWFGRHWRYNMYVRNSLMEWK